jgi:hypothetical protein
MDKDYEDTGKLMKYHVTCKKNRFIIRNDIQHYASRDSFNSYTLYFKSKFLIMILVNHIGEEIESFK